MATKKQWTNEFNMWLKRFNMVNGYAISFEFIKQKDVPSQGPNFQYAATTSSIPEYKEHGITVNKDWLEETSLTGMKETACHEAIHLVTSPLHSIIMRVIEELPKTKQDIYRDWYRREDEEVTTHLTSILQGMELNK